MVAVFLFFLIRAICVIRGSLFLFSGYRLDHRQEIPKFPIVYLNSVIQIKADPMVGVMAQFFIKGLEFGLLFDELVPLLFNFFRWAVEAALMSPDNCSIRAEIFPCKEA